jgi:hypothetical protein
MQLSAPANLV